MNTTHLDPLEPLQQILEELFLLFPLWALFLLDGTGPPHEKKDSRS